LSSKKKLFKKEILKKNKLVQKSHIDMQICQLHIHDVNLLLPHLKSALLG